jgi:hypothetical protein
MAISTTWYRLRAQKRIYLQHSLNLLSLTPYSLNLLSLVSCSLSIIMSSSYSRQSSGWALSLYNVQPVTPWEKNLQIYRQPPRKSIKTHFGHR